MGLLSSENLTSRTSESNYTTGEEIANGITHGIGAGLSIAGLVLLVYYAAVYGNAWHIVSCAIYGTTLVLLYTVSTLYHSIPSPRVKSVMQILDHSAIFLLIAGTYTPFTLVSLRGPWGWSLLGVIWGAALLGILFQTALQKSWVALTVGLYILMGWAVIVAIQPLLSAVPAEAFVLLLAGGLAYTLGTLFFIWKQLKFHHAIWHLFVLAGSALHFFAVFYYVIPA
ncbi:MAG: hemolysin III [Desulfuromonas sp.]|nr:MAG: hemolysin III [Desulfuromonas sp.]